MHRNNFDSSTIFRYFKGLTTRALPFAAAVGAMLLLWHAVRDYFPAAAEAPAAAVSTPAVALPALGVAPPIVVQQASVASTIEVIVRRNVTLDAIFRRLALDTADLATIRNLPGIRQSLDFLKPGDSIKVTHTDGTIEELTRKVSESKTLDVVRGDGGFAAKMVDNPVETRIRTASATIDSSLFQAAEAAEISDVIALNLASVFA